MVAEVVVACVACGAAGVGGDLVRGVNERDESGRADGLGDARPLRRRWVDARRVVSARVKEHHRASGQRLQSGEHPVEVEAAGARVKVGVVRDGQPDGGEDVGVDRPRRRRQVDCCARPEDLQHACR